MRRFADSTRAARVTDSVSRQRAMAKQRKNLKGYKQKGKRFIPPMKQLSQLREHSYVNDMLPELIWLGLIHDSAGYRFGAKVLEAVVEVTQELPAQDNSFNFALQIAYAKLPEETKAQILERWDQEDLLCTIRDAISPLILLYDGCALAFVGPPKNVYSQDELIGRISRTVENHLDKTQTPGAVLHGAMLLTRLMAGTIKFSQHIEIPDLNAVVENPESEEARKAASFMRANAGAEWGMLKVPPDWAKHFWNRNGELKRCELPEYLKQND